MSSNPEDLTPQARIRAAAVDLFGSQGFDKTTIRQIASRAGVSPGLVIHHFGSKNELRTACDEWVIDVLSSEKALLVVGPVPRLDSYIEQHPEFAGVMAYLVTTLREGGQMATQVYDRLYVMTQEMLGMASEAGLLNPTDDPEGRVALMVAMSCGLMLLGDQVASHLGGTSLTDPRIVERYSRLGVELFSGGLFTPAYADALRAASSSPESEVHE